MVSPSKTFLFAAATLIGPMALASQKPGDPEADKTGQIPQPAFTAIDPSMPGPQLLVSANPPGTTLSATTTFTNSTGLAIPDATTVSQSLVVSAVGTYLWDVDLSTSITHTYGADLDITLTAPTGHIVSVTTDNGGANDDVFNGTLWDDSAADAATKYVYTNLITATPLNVEGAFTSLRGLNPNGSWTLTIVDDAGADVGNMSSWSLAITTLTGTVPSASSPTTFTSSPNLAITDFTTSSDSITASGLGTNTAEVRVYVEITHTYGADLDIYVTSPIGTVIELSNNNGGASDDVFNGTTFYDDARTATTDLAASNYVYVNLVVAPNLAPDGELSRAWGQDPNGSWTLSVYDDAGADTGTLVRWDLIVRTYGAGPPPPPAPYCTAGTTTNGCLASINATNNPSLTQAQSCIVNVTNVEGQKSALIFYGITGGQAVSWGAGSNSLLCVKPATQRSQGLNTGGTANTCNGSLAWNWDAFQAANPGAVGNPWTLGEKAWVQAWFRDPTAVKTTNLSNAVELTYQP